jgi:hypothetical protein
VVVLRAARSAIGTCGVALTGVDGELLAGLALILTAFGDRRRRNFAIRRPLA